MNNPADTLAALADKLETQAGRRVPKWTDRPTQSPPMRYRYDEDTRAFMAGIAADLRALASLKGEAVPILKPLEWDDHSDEWMCEKGFHIEDLGENPDQWDDKRFRVVWGEGEPECFDTLEEAKADCARQWAEFVGGQIYHPTPSPDPQADKDLMQRTVDKVVSKVMGQREEILQAFVAKYGFQPDEAVQVVGADGSWRVMRRQDMSTPSPAPQGGGNRRQAVIDAIRRDLDATGAATIRYAELEMLLATPPAQQPGEVGGVRVTHQMILRAQTAVPSRGNAPAIYYSETQAILEAALAPKEKGNG